MTKLENSTSDVPKETVTNTEETSTSDIAKEDELRAYLSTNLTSINPTLSTQTFDLNALMGAPFKYSVTDDPPSISGGEYGRSYMEQFMEWGNIVTFTPGIGHFLPGFFNKDAKEALASASVNTEGKSDENQEMDEAIMKAEVSKLYTFSPQSKMYWEYVNTIWRNLIALADLNHKPSRLATYYTQLGTNGAVTTTSEPSTNLGDIRWGSVNESSALNRILYGGLDGEIRGIKNHEFSFIPFYNDGPVSSNDGFDNQTGESTLGAKINQIPGEEISRELGFMSGAMYDANAEYNRENKDQRSGSGLRKFWDTGTKLKTFGVKTTIPDVWKDSGSSSRDQSFTFKFACCDGSPESYAIHTLRGLAHLLALALPIHHKGNFAFSAPMLVKVWTKGISNIDIGIITSLQIQKDPKSITAYGLMTDMTVTVTVKDLTPVVALPANRLGVGAESAIGYISLIGGLTGCNVALVDWTKWNVSMAKDNFLEMLSPHRIINNIGRASSDILGLFKANWRG